MANSERRKKHDNKVASPKNAKKHNNKGFAMRPCGKPIVANSERRKKHDNNVASAHCVNNSEGRKIVKAHKGLKPLVIKIL